MLNVIIDLWSVADEALKAWAKIQFARAFPLDVIEDAQKNAQMTMGRYRLVKP